MKLNPPQTLLLFRGSFIITVISITILSLIDLRGLPPIHVWDKWQHTFAFLVLSYLLDESLPQQQTRRTLHPAQMLILLGYGVLIEWLQSFTIYREASFYDVVADVTGITIYWCIYFIRHTGKTVSQR